MSWVWIACQISLRYETFELSLVTAARSVVVPGLRLSGLDRCGISAGTGRSPDTAWFAASNTGCGTSMLLIGAGRPGAGAAGGAPGAGGGRTGAGCSATSAGSAHTAAWS